MSEQETSHDNIMQQHFTKLERMIADQVSLSHGQARQYHRTSSISFQAYETIHRFENLQRQNNLIIHRLTTVEDMMVANHNLLGSSEILNNGRPAHKQPG